MNNLKFVEYNYALNNVITPHDIYLAINRFCIEILNQNHKGKLSLIFKVITLNSNLLDISPLIVDNKLKINELIEILVYYWISQSYTTKNLVIKEIVFSYRFIDSSIESASSVFKCSNKLKLIDTPSEDYINLPNNRLFETWSDNITINSNNTYIINIDIISFYYVIKLSNEYFIWFKNNNLEIEYFYDTYSSNKSDKTFIRRIGNCTLYYNNSVYYIL